MNDNPIYVKGVCQACGGPLEFEARLVGRTVDCPHCGMPTVLNGNGEVPPQTSEKKTEIQKLKTRGRTFSIVGALCLLLAVGVLSFCLGRKTVHNADGEKISSLNADATPNRKKRHLNMKKKGMDWQ